MAVGADVLAQVWRKQPGVAAAQRIGVLLPNTNSAIASPVTGARVMPSIACPVATNRLSNPGARPITGRPSGVNGRMPVHSTWAAPRVEPGK